MSRRTHRYNRLTIGTKGYGNANGSITLGGSGRNQVSSYSWSHHSRNTTIANQQDSTTTIPLSSYHPGGGTPTQSSSSMLMGLGQFLEILLCMGTNLYHGTTLDERGNLLPSLAVLFEALEEETVFLGGPSAGILGCCRRRRRGCCRGCRGCCSTTSSSSGGGRSSRVGQVVVMHFVVVVVGGGVVMMLVVEMVVVLNNGRSG